MAGERLYTDLAPWWPLVSDPADYAEEAAVYRHALEATARRELQEVLELGSGGGSNASHLKAFYDLTLVDRAPAMLAVSRMLNPTLAHVEGDMRSVRLERSFDAVFVHDAVSYLTTEEDLRACFETAFRHCRPGGVALFTPEETKETFQPYTRHGGRDLGDRSLRYLEWTYDPDPDDTTTVTQMAYLLREEGRPVDVVRDEHVLGLFPRDTWLRLLDDAGFRPTALPFHHSTFPPGADHELFLGIRPWGEPGR